MVVRVADRRLPHGGAIWHSQCGESIFAHVPGLLIAFPSRARDAAGLLRTAFRCEDPVLFLEHKHLLPPGATSRDPYAARRTGCCRSAAATSVDPAATVTVVTWGATVAEVAASGRSSSDADAGRSRSSTCARSRRGTASIVAESVRRTGRVLVRARGHAHRAASAPRSRRSSPTSASTDLDAPVRRVAAADTHVAYEPTLENAILPQVDDIVAAIAATVA